MTKQSHGKFLDRRASDHDLRLCQESLTVFLQLCTVSVWTGYLRLGLGAGLLLPILGVDCALPQVLCQIEVTSPTKKVRDNEGLNSCEISPCKSVILVRLFCLLMLNIQRRYH